LANDLKYKEINMFEKSAAFMKPLILTSIIAALLLTLVACSSEPSKPASSMGNVSSAASSALTSTPAVSSSVVSSVASASSSVSATVTVHESSDPQVIKLYTQASQYFTDDNYTAAVSDCDAALKIDPLCYEAMDIKGVSQYYATGDPEQGFPLIEQSLKINPNYQYGYFNEALIYKGEKNWDKSIGLFDKVIQIAPDNAWAYYGISTIYADRNMVPQSLDYLKQAIDIDPSVKATARVQNHYDRMRSNPNFQALVK
jgi:tetratricopeptide (TPR) repeat protein